MKTEVGDGAFPQSICDHWISYKALSQAQVSQRLDGVKQHPVARDTRLVFAFYEVHHMLHPGRKSMTGG